LPTHYDLSISRRFQADVGFVEERHGRIALAAVQEEAIFELEVG
jgi:hypothetical protein